MCMHSQSSDMKISLSVTLYFMETSLLLYRYQAFRGSPELCFTFLWSCFTPTGSFFTWYFYNSLQFSGFLFDSGTPNYGCLALKKQQTYRVVFFLHNNVCRFVGLLQLFRVLGSLGFSALIFSYCVFCLHDHKMVTRPPLFIGMRLE